VGTAFMGLTSCRRITTSKTLAHGTRCATGFMPTALSPSAVKNCRFIKGGRDCPHAIRSAHLCRRSGTRRRQPEHHRQTHQGRCFQPRPAHADLAARASRRGRQRSQASVSFRPAEVVPTGQIQRQPITGRRRSCLGSVSPAPRRATDTTTILTLQAFSASADLSSLSTPDTIRT
jgi:hypothetical protein